MKGFMRKLIVIVCILLFALSNYSLIHANSCEPPSIIIIVKNPPKDLEINVVTSEYNKPGIKRVASWEGYYAFYLGHKLEDSYRFQVSFNDIEFECVYNEKLVKYRNFLTLDIKSKSLTKGLYPYRTISIIILRVMITLLIESIIFYLYKFRNRWSWSVFLITNLVTQLVLNYWLLKGGSLYYSGYTIPLKVIYGEFFVFTTEMIIMLCLINERRKLSICGYTLMSNFISLILGGFILMFLPI